MVESKGKATTVRARIAHKLARYYRATPIHLGGLTSAASPSTSHLTLGGAPKRRVRNSQNTWYPADDERAYIKRATSSPKASTGRASVHPGSVVILLSGANRGRRVVVLKRLASGNLLVTGPHSLNGVSLGRVNAAYVLATTTRVSLEGVTANIDDSFFKRGKRFTKNELKNASETRAKQAEEGKAHEAKWKAELKTVQKAVDGQLIANIKKVPHLSGYLGTRFTLSNTTRPHELAF
jgi:large subunit ribosomal protein L6e